MSRPEDKNLGPLVATDLEGHKTLTISSRWLGTFWALVVVVALSFYVLDLGSYPSAVTLFPTIISLPTLGLAVAYLVKELVSLARLRVGASGQIRRPTRDSNESGIPADSALIPNEMNADSKGMKILEGESDPAKVRLTGLGLAVGLTVAYAVLFRVLGFAVDSVALIVVGPLVFGQPLRRAPILILVGVILVIILSILVHLSGVFPLPTGVFHIGVS